MRSFLLLLLLFCLLSENFLLGCGLPTIPEKATKDNGNSSSKNHLLSSLVKYHLLIPYQLEDGVQERKNEDLRTEHPNVTGIHKTNVFFVVEIEESEYLLNLTLNHNLLPRTFSTSTYSIDDNLITKETNENVYDHCYYQGEVTGISGSHVVLSTCSGLRGYIILPDDFLIIEPLESEGSEIANIQHVVYRPSDQQQKENIRPCGNKDLQSNVEAILDSVNSAHLRRKRGLTPENIKYVELMVVADSYEARRFATSGELEAHVKELINYVDAFYHKLGIRIILAHLEIWKNADRVKLSTNAQETLDTFLDFRESMMLSEPASSPWVYADNFHLLCGRDFDEVIVGIASSGTMCTSRSGGVSQDTSTNVISTAAIVAHEIGHNFGMSHDTAECSCPTSKDNCIMTEASGYKPPTDWSSCSHAYLEENVKFGSQSCLLNVPLPNRIYFVGVCGNDIVEEGEECDCGHTYDCTSECCNASSCMLMPGAQCDGEACCSSCLFKPARTLCRDKVSEECDLVERCTGNSAHCPDNLFLENGSPCDNNSALCVEGVCLNFDLQCESTWGPGSVNSHEICYTELNVRGDEIGNCGYNQTDQAFIACSREHARCGKLQCSGGALRPVIDQNRATVSSSINVGETDKTFVCKTIASKPVMTDAAYQGLVRDGTKCAENKVCSEGRCISTRASTCPFECYGHGHCSSDGHCHCDSGWEQPYCHFLGTGGTECGNDVVDEGEECDCGHLDECESHCCNASTCRLLPGASCDSGICCADCQYLISSTICRGRNGNICDFHEYCTGTSADCPDDVHKQDGTLCDDGKAMCYQGICLTRELQCNEIWGGSSLNGADLCYNLLNVRGRIDGNCGFDEEGNFRRCSAENVFCGTLQCQNGAASPIISGVQFSYQSNIVTRSETLKCRSIASNKLSSDRRLLGSVKDGTMCGPDKMCMEGVCQKFRNASDTSKPCECNEHGHCDNFDHCHCDRGWAAPDCAKRGISAPECGDHFIDEGEECDCGHPNVCKSKCCDAITCRLLPGAVCDDGVCCDKCHFVSGGTICRRADRNECDLPEYCTGYSANCPSDVYMENGSPCSGKRTGKNAVLGPVDAFCYNGFCRTHDASCQDLWGENASSSADICYIYVNAVGNINGNCGPKEIGGFSKCSKIDALCGKLQCQGGGKRPNTTGIRRAFNNRLTYGRKKVVCKTLQSPSEKATFENDAGLVKDGTVCAPGKMCNRGTCKAVSNSTCSLGCNGHGACNHLGHCHCDRGWAPPYCTTAGGGGSVDSEVITI